MHTKQYHDPELKERWVPVVREALELPLPVGAPRSGDIAARAPAGPGRIQRDSEVILLRGRR